MNRKLSAIIRCLKSIIAIMELVKKVWAIIQPYLN